MKFNVGKCEDMQIGRRNQMVGNYLNRKTLQINRELIDLDVILHNTQIVSMQT